MSDPRWSKLSPQAKATIKTISRLIISGVDTIDLNQLRQSTPDSQSLLTTLRELQSRGLGYITKNQSANPAFVVNCAQVQQLVSQEVSRDRSF